MNSRRRTQSETPNLLIQLGRGIVALLRLLIQPRGRFDHVQMKATFADIEHLTEQDDGVHPAQAVLQADSFLDEVMKRSCGAGPHFADRLKALGKRFDRNLYHLIWQAHKLRNQIAHEHPRVSRAAAKDALSVFRRAASVLGAL